MAVRFAIAIIATLALLACLRIAGADPPIRTPWPHDAAPSAEYDPASGRINVSWPAVEGATSYVVWWVNDSNRFDSGEARAMETATSLSRNGGFADGKWNIRVRTANGGAWSNPTTVTIAGAPPELTLKIESSRELCTEGTLTEIRWSANGGTSPLTLQINGDPVTELNGTAKVNCGLIPRTEDGEIDETQRDAVITSFLLDGRGTIKSASIRVPRTEALPAPMNLRSSSGIGWIQVFWDAVAGAGAQSPAVGGGISDRTSYVIRHRSSVTADWETLISYSRPKHNVDAWSTSTSTDQTGIEVSVAAIRHPIELETSAALQWAPSLTVVSLTPPQNLSATTTHDTLTVQFDRQPHGSGGWIQVSVPGRNGGLTERYWEDGSTGRHEVVFAGLPPDTDLEIIVDAGRSYEPFSKITARTLPAPPNWTAPQHGAQNLRATPRSTSINVQWDLPNNDVQHGWLVIVRDITGSGNAPIATRWLASDTTEVEIRGGGAYWSVGPARTYRIQVLELGLVNDQVVEMVVTTPALQEGLPQQSSTDTSTTGDWEEHATTDVEPPMSSG